MTIGELMEDSREEGRTEGHTAGLEEGRTGGHTAGLQEGMRRMLALTGAMMKNGDGQLIPSLEGDRELLAQMYKKYHI